MMRRKLKIPIPAGIDYELERKWLQGGLALSVIYSLGFFIRLTSSRSQLFETVGGKRILVDGAVMANFSEVLGSALLGFLIVLLLTIPLAAYHYFYHYQGSKSIYLMRRLPDRWELLRRCVSLPVAVAAFMLLIAVLLLFLYYGIYCLATPEGCMRPRQWQILWNTYLGG